MVNSMTTDLQALFMERKNRIMLIMLLHSIERNGIGDVRIRVETINVEKLVFVFAPGCPR